jgi:hypothetical protein
LNKYTNPPTGRLAERFEAAYQAFALTYFWKVRLHNAYCRYYSCSEFREDLTSYAREQGLSPEALWAYFKRIHPGPMLLAKDLHIRG